MPAYWPVNPLYRYLKGRIKTVHKGFHQGCPPWYYLHNWKQSKWPTAKNSFIKVHPRLRESTNSPWALTLCWALCWVLKTQGWTQRTLSMLSQNRIIKDVIFREYFMSWGNVHDTTSQRQIGLQPAVNLFIKTAWTISAHKFMDIRSAHFFIFHKST